MRILLQNDSMDAIGGIGRAGADLANAMSRRGHDVVLLGRLKKRTPACYTLDSAVEIRPCAISDDNRRVQKLRRQLMRENFDACVSMHCGPAHLLWAVILLGSGIPFIMSERAAPDLIETALWNRPGRLACISGADFIHFLLPEFASSVPEHFRERVRCIPHALELSDRTADLRENPHGKNTLLWLGRLDDSIKQCRLALDAFSLLAKRFPTWNMHVVGDGPDRFILEAHAARLGLAPRVRFCGQTADAASHYAAAKLFCMSSRSESFGRTTVEAMSHGLPAVGFAACSGTNRLIEHGVNGLLADPMTAEALAEQLACLMRDEEARLRMGKNALLVKERYAATVVFDQWETLFREASALKGRTAMDAFAEEPFASKARLSAAARREYILRDFGRPMPGSPTYAMHYARSKLKAAVSGIPSLLARLYHAGARRLPREEQR